MSSQALDRMYYPPVQAVPHVSSLSQYQQLYEESVRDPAGFWGRIARSDFHWHKPFSDAMTVSYNFDTRVGPISVKWFSDGETNLCYNCLDRHVEAGFGSTPCLFHEGNEPHEQSVVTYAEMLEMVCRIANVLQNDAGVVKGDSVAIYMPMAPPVIAAMLACTRIGAVHSVIFAGFSSDSVRDRILDAQSKVVLTADGFMRGTKAVHLKELVDKAVDGVACVRRVYVWEHLGLGSKHASPSFKMQAGRDFLAQPLLAAAPTMCPVVWLNAEDPLFMLYTSGSTGKPKGVLHTVGGYMVYAAVTFKMVFDYHPGQVYFCTADVGWISGHSYTVYGPFLNRATQVCFEGVPTYPDASRLWEMCERLSVNILYTAPTAIRSLMKLGDDPIRKHCLKSLRVLGSVGEPINPAAWLWYHEVVGGGRCPIVDTFWQTETGGHMMTPLPFATPLKPGSASFPFFGVVPAVLDDQGRELEGLCSGYLCFKGAWPGMMRTVFGDHERFEKTYFSMFKGYYMTGDGCRRDEDGYYWLTGRVDDVMNVSGHRMGTAEVESALLLHVAVAEAAVVPFPHDIKGEGIYCYVTLKQDIEPSESLRAELKATVREHLGAIATPDVVHWAPGLPKTRSGKIIRRMLRKLAAREDDNLGDRTTLADPGVIDLLISLRGK